MRTIYLGNTAITNVRLGYPIDSLKKHMAVFGGSGSGKTVLCKVIIEDCAKEGIPSILVDPQGDLASLAIRHHNAIIFTPSSTKGVPISINPLKKPAEGLDEEDYISIVNQVASTIAGLLGYKDNDKGKGASSALYIILQYCWKNNVPLRSFEELATVLDETPEKARRELRQIISEPDLKVLIKKIKYLTIGSKKLLFELGTPLDINVLLEKDRISIIYLNSLETEEEKQFFVSMLATELYQWMLGHPKQTIQALFYIDEISTFIPAGALKPITKPILKLIYKQARKYGIGCIVSTQNPGDIDYTAMAQFGSWAIGRLTTNQDRAKIMDALKSLTPNIKQIDEKIPSLKPGEFMIFSPDSFTEIKHVKVRMIQDHKTLTEEDVKAITTDDQRKKFKTIREMTEHSHGSEKESHVPGIKHFEVKINHSQAYKIAESKKKKLFGIIGPAKENIIDSKLIMIPLLKTVIKQVETKLLGLKKSSEEYVVLFNQDGPTTISENYPDFAKIYHITDNELEVLRNLNNEMTAKELEGKIGMSFEKISKTLGQLNERKLITKRKGKEGMVLWTSFENLNIPALSKLNTQEMEISTTRVEAETLKPEFDTKTISEAINKWYASAEMIYSEIVYYPIYEFSFMGKKGSRKIKISAVDGKEIN